MASRAVGRLEIGDVEFFEDVLSGDHTLVDPIGVEAAVITASCVDYSSAGAQAGPNGTWGWQVVDSPRVLLHFRDLLVSLVENVWGWISANDGSSFLFFTKRPCRGFSTEPQQVNLRNLGMAIQSERAFVFTNRREFDGKLGPPRRLDRISRPSVPMRCKLLPIAEILRRRVECELAVVPGSSQTCVVHNQSAGPVRIGSAEFASVKGGGSPRVGAKVTLTTPKQVWRVFATHADGRLRLRSGTNVVTVRPERPPVVHAFRVFVY